MRMWNNRNVFKDFFIEKCWSKTQPQQINDTLMAFYRCVYLIAIIIIGTTWSEEKKIIIIISSLERDFFRQII